MPLVFNEDKAIKNKFMGITVTDETAPPTGRPVTVRFRLPETELADADFPMIILDPAGPMKADDREHRGNALLPYVPEQVPEAERDSVTTIDPRTGLEIPFEPQKDVTNSPFASDYPIPFDFDYTATVLARKQSHLVQLMSTLAQVDRIPARFGWVDVEEDDTIRSLFLTGGPEVVPVKDSDDKRTFRAVYRIRIPSEMNTYQYRQYVEGDYIREIDLDVEQTNR